MRPGYYWFHTRKDELVVINIDQDETATFCGNDTPYSMHDLSGLGVIDSKIEEPT